MGARTCTGDVQGPIRGCQI